MTRRAFFLAALAIVLFTRRLQAEDRASSVAAAEALFREGRALLEQGQVERACDRLSRSQQLDPAVGTLISLGGCYARLGRIASAWGVYQQASTLATTLHDDARAASARASAAQLEPRLSRLEIKESAPGAGKESAATVTRNGVVVDSVVRGVAVPVDPGPQEIVASATGKKTWRTTIELQEGERRTVVVPALAPATADPRTSALDEPRPRPTALRDTGTVIAIGGGVILASGLVLGGVAAGQWSTIEDTCPGGLCPSERDRARLADDASGARSLAAVSTVGTVLGAVALAAGVVLHLAGRP